jgi:hypothetical protein
MSKKQDKDGRSITSKANVRKAQAVKAQRQREEKKDIEEFIKRRRGQKKVKEDIPKETPKLKRTKKKIEYESESEESSDEEQLVISSKKIKRNKKPTKDESELDEIEMLKEEIAQLKMQKKKRAYPPRKRKEVEEPIQQPIQQPATVQPIINIHNPAPQVIEHKQTDLVQKMKEGILRFD